MALKPGKRQIAAFIKLLEEHGGTAEEVAEAALTFAWEEMAKRQRFLCVGQFRGRLFGTRPRIGKSDAPDTWAFPPTATYRQSEEVAERAMRSPQGHLGHVWVVPIIGTPREAWNGLRIQERAAGRKPRYLVRVESVANRYMGFVEGLPGIRIEEDTDEDVQASAVHHLAELHGSPDAFDVVWEEPWRSQAPPTAVGG